jgi:iron(III) transport system substrate-binding protein
MKPRNMHAASVGRLVAMVVCLVALLAALMLTGCPRNGDQGPVRIVVSDDNGPAQPMDREAIIKAARVEGEMTWYTSAPDKAADGFLGAFREEYPFIRTHLRRSSTFDTISKINAEIDSGTVRADCVHVLDVGVFIELRQRGELLPYTSPEESAIDEKFRESSYWWAMRLVAIAMAYNSDTVPPGQAPDTWEDLLRPQFKGKIGFKDAVTAGTAYAQYFLLREKYGRAFWERMARQDPKISRSADEVMDALLSGEILVAGEMAGYKILAAQEEPGPIVGVWPAEGVPFIPGPVAILARSGHPNAAKLFVDFALSKEGQERFRDLVRAYSARVDVSPLEGQPPLKSLNLLTPTGGWSDYLEKQNSLRAEFEELFRPGSE